MGHALLVSLWKRAKKTELTSVLLLALLTFEH